MFEQRTQRFGLTDLMILIVAVAISLSINKASNPFVLSFSSFANVINFLKALGLVALVMPHLVCLGLATIVIRLRRPRVKTLRLVRQPGFVACFVASVAVSCFMFVIAANLALGHEMVLVQEMVTAGGSTRSSHTSIHTWPVAFAIYADRVGFAVGGAWMVQWLQGCWRPDRSWIDRLGRALGFSWLFVTLFMWVRSFCFWSP
jgi:hypothetical protein